MNFNKIFGKKCNLDDKKVTKKSKRYNFRQYIF